MVLVRKVIGLDFCSDLVGVFMINYDNLSIYKDLLELQILMDHIGIFIKRELVVIFKELSIKINRLVVVCTND